jgi:hypothetical protein
MKCVKKSFVSFLRRKEEREKKNGRFEIERIFTK